MTAEQFCYWLQGYFELKQTIDHREGATPETMKVIEDQLKTVFVKVTPPVKSPVTTTEEALRRYRESEQRLPNPYSPNGIQPVITC
jgi:hypothetical protein